MNTVLLMLLFPLMSLCSSSAVRHDETVDYGKDGKFLFLSKPSQEASSGCNGEMMAMEGQITSSETKLKKVLQGIKQLIAKASSSVPMPGSCPQSHSFTFSPDNSATLDNSNNITNIDIFKSINNGSLGGGAGGVNANCVMLPADTNFAATLPMLPMNSPTICAMLCQTLGFPVAAVQSTTCNCLATQPNPSQTVSTTPSPCNVPCVPDGTTTCGGPLGSMFFSVIPSSGGTVTPPGNPGGTTQCLTLTDPSIFGATLPLLPANSPTICSGVCQVLMQPFSAVQGSTCSCLTSNPATTASTGTCNTACIPDMTLTCGGPGSDFTVSPSAQFPGTGGPAPATMCLTIDTPNIVGPTVSPVPSNSPATCSGLCLALAQPFFAVQGTTCSCLTADPSAMGAAMGTCDTLCPTNPALTCGGVGTSFSVGAAARTASCLSLNNQGNVGFSTPLPANSPTICAGICGSLQFPFSAVQSLTCTCLTADPALNGALPGTCNVPCSPTQTLTCGGLGTSFTVSPTADLTAGVNAPTPSCVNIDPTTISTMFPVLPVNSPLTCATLCGVLLQPSSAVQGPTCVCLTAAPGTGAALPATDCSTPCVPPLPGVSCGGVGTAFSASAAINPNGMVGANIGCFMADTNSIISTIPGLPAVSTEICSLACSVAGAAATTSVGFQTGICACLNAQPVQTSNACVPCPVVATCGVPLTMNFGVAAAVDASPLEPMAMTLLPSGLCADVTFPPSAALPDPLVPAVNPPVMDSTFPLGIFNSPQSCQTFCLAQMYLNSAVRMGDCACFSDQVPINGVLDLAMCNTPCPNPALGICGGTVPAATVFPVPV